MIVYAHLSAQVEFYDSQRRRVDEVAEVTAWIREGQPILFDGLIVMLPQVADLEIVGV